MDDTINSGNFFDEKTEKLLRDIAESEGFHDYKIEKGDGSIKGDGYIGIIKAAKISTKNNSDVLHLVVKSATKSDALRSQTIIEDLFHREIYMYNTVFATFKALQEEKELPPFNFTPKLYNSLTEKKYETLILEDLKESGYKLCERRIPMNEEHVCLVLTECGRLHALSFALRDQYPEKFKMVLGCLDDLFVKGVQKTEFTNNLMQQCVIGQEALNENSDKEVLDIYKAFIDTIPPFFDTLLDSVDEYSVALYGDCWTNNMMFKYEDKANPTKPTRVRFFDFQLSRLGSPVIDLSYFLYSCSPKEVINNLNKYLEIYYKSFSDYLQKLGSDPNKMFPYLVLQQHWKKYARFGLVLSLIVIHIMLTESEEAIDLANVSESGKGLSNPFVYKIKKFHEYKERIRPIILHFVERGFI